MTAALGLGEEYQLGDDKLPADVVAWRREELLRLGYLEPIAAEFANDREPDLHQLEDLIAAMLTRGYEPTRARMLALRIAA